MPAPQLVLLLFMLIILLVVCPTSVDAVLSHNNAVCHTAPTARYQLGHKAAAVRAKSYSFQLASDL